MLAFLIGFVPPSQFSHSSVVVYGLLILAGILLIGVVPPLLLYRLRKPSWKMTPAVGERSRRHGAGRQRRCGGHQAVSCGHFLCSRRASRFQRPLGHRLDRRHERRAGRGFGAASSQAAMGYRGRPDRLAGRRTADLQARQERRSSPAQSRPGRRPVCRPPSRRSGRSQDARSTFSETTGGPICANPSGALTKGLQDQQLSNGAATVGSRPIRVDRQVFYGEELVVSVYCPAKLAALHTYVNGNAFYRVIRK